MSAFSMFDELRSLYVLPGDPLVEEILIPGFKNAMNVDCMVGFFSSEVLATLAPGLAAYIYATSNSFRLIISPLLSEKDRSAIEDGLMSADRVAQKALERLIVTEDLLKIHTLKCLSWLIRNNRIEIKVALMKDALFHPKVWLFRNGEDVIAVHGSCNVTHAGIHRNIEQVAISRSWQDHNQQYATGRLRNEFGHLWQNKKDNCLVFGMPEAVRQKLLQSYNQKAPPTEDEFRELYKRASVAEECRAYEAILIPTTRFEIPNEFRYEDGPFQHQGKAVTAWQGNGWRGILEMATGSGKTIASMIGAHRLYKRRKPLIIVVAAPYLPLIEQWCDEIALFGLKPLNIAATGSPDNRTRELQRLRRRLHMRISDVEIIVASHVTLSSPDFLNSIESFKCSRLLIADEVHNLGRPSFINNPPKFFEYRLGLSATPVRQYDGEGTATLLNYFGPIVFQYTLEQAIGRCLVEYDYYIHPVYLTDNEMDEWFDLTTKIKQNAWRSIDDPDDYLLRLLRDRRALLEAASGKISMLKMLLDKEDVNHMRHTLVYTSDKGPNQLENVNRLMQQKNILFHQLTAKETSNRENMKQIIASFQNAELQILTAKRVLDEGVNIPQICKAYILASTTVERQWIQRRGRLLRKCDSISKTHSVIHDLLALPPGIEEGLDPDARALVRSELLRAQAFARLARNAGRTNGPLDLIDKMVDAAYL